MTTHFASSIKYLTNPLPTMKSHRIRRNKDKEKFLTNILICMFNPSAQKWEYYIHKLDDKFL